MDSVAADLPCIIQALPAHSEAPPPTLVQALPALPSPPKPHPPPPPATAAAKRRPPPPPPALGPAPPSPRRTRSGGAPEWTPAETLALVAEVAAVDDGWSRSVSAFQKWAMVAENLAAASEALAGARRGRGSKRAAGECRRRWEALAAEYGAVRRWEVRTGGAYWEMGTAARRKAGLPAEFDAEVYGAMDALIRVEEALFADAAGGGAGGEEVEGLVGGGAGAEVAEQDQDGGEAEVAEEHVHEDASAGEEDASAGEEEQQEEEDVDEEEEDEEADNEDGEEMLVDGGNTDALNGLEGHETGTHIEPEKSQNIAWELANKLHENAQHIHTILNEEAAEGAVQNHALANSISADAMVTTRQKADELIKSLGGLVSYLNQFSELVKETGFENMVGMT
ncbi:hypothetical protein U9M48_025542 [Paspalum notatum var. saurae]|uniref:Myb-like domain-containing protein n=1 Tax=Paspalum notatum var. saurae TaxID=547442 RepID=A0AAQ3TQY0_PASNO